MICGEGEATGPVKQKTRQCEEKTRRWSEGREGRTCGVHVNEDRSCLFLWSVGEAGRSYVEVEMRALVVQKMEGRSGLSRISP